MVEIMLYIAFAID